MKLLGYQRVHGEKDDKKWDFVNLFIERENVNPGPEIGGCQLVTTFSKNRGIQFPSISTDNFTRLLRNGLTPGDSIKVYRDFDGTIVVEKL